MSESREVPYDQLPAWVREDLERMRKTLGPELKFGRVCEMNGAWVATICTLDGHEGGQFMITDQSEEQPPTPSWLTARRE